MPNPAPFDAVAFAAREVRRIERLRRAAWAIMRTHPSAPEWCTAERLAMVDTWVAEALEWRAERLERKAS